MFLFSRPGPQRVIQSQWTSKYKDVSPRKMKCYYREKKVRVARLARVTDAIAVYVCMLKIYMNMEIYIFSYLIISCSYECEKKFEDFIYTFKCI